ncbi:hypothetical protein GIB67_032522 [Kingdonia uniflora]|uniref:Alcohol dehydrogenase-like C-terminal domain-containing protein n=1 Tax=Kingdonia uniflora TaxID=39325 RepID=A0A7J7L7V9_9MAGN|nr:hypothetical protein GIB67_032522 [Kingdonia uniflora]
MRELYLEGARMRGASKIIGMDINERKREKGGVFGMADFINPTQSNKSISVAIKEMTNGLSMDCIYECSGVSSLINEALEATTFGKGVVTIIGMGEQSTPISLFSLLGRTLKGSILGGLKPQSDLPVIVDKCIAKYD